MRRHHYLSYYVLRVSVGKGAAGLIMLLASLTSVQAQDFEFDEEALLVEETEAKIRYQDFFFGETGAILAQGNGITRQSYVANVGVDYPFDNGRVFAKYGGINYSLSYTEELFPNLINTSAAVDKPTERGISRTFTDIDLREGFVQYSLGSFASISAGRISNVWGQFELLTPTMMMLPTTANVTSLLPNKVDLFTAQDQVRLSVFPTRKFEMQLHLMGDILGDAAREDNVILWMPPLGSPDSFEFQSKHKKGTSQQAARFIYYPDWGTVGITWHKGVNAFHPLLHSPVGKFNQNGVSALPDDVIQVGADVFSDITLVSSVYNSTEDTYLFYPEGELFAFEASIPVGQNWVWRGEYAVIDTIDALGYYGNYTISRPDIPFQDSHIREFFSRINDPSRPDNLRGTSLYESTRTFSAVGFLYKGRLNYELPVSLPKWLWDTDTTWNISATLLILSTQPRGGSAQSIKSAFDRLWQQQPNAPKNTPDDQVNFALPLFTVIRNYGDENQHLYGIGGGILGGGIGLAGLYRYNITDDLSAGVTIGPLNLGSGQEGDLFYRLKTGDGLFNQLTKQVSISWRF